MRKIITSLIAILVVTNLEAQQRTPRLVVCITVDQLRGDYIEYFYNTFGERGFKRLMNEGLVYNNIKFEFSDIDQASAFATLFTGSNPWRRTEDCIQRQKRRVCHCPRCGECNPFCRSCGKRSILDGRHEREMGDDHLL